MDGSRGASGLFLLFVKNTVLVALAALLHGLVKAAQGVARLGVQGLGHLDVYRHILVALTAFLFQGSSKSNPS